METNYTSPMEGLLHRGDFLHIPPLLLTAHRHEYHNHQKNKLFPAYPNHFDLSERNKVTYTNSQGYIKMHLKDIMMSRVNNLGHYSFC